MQTKKTAPVKSPVDFEGDLFFNITSLARTINAVADEEFQITGLAPSSAFILLLANKMPGISAKEISMFLNLQPSTITRLVDALEAKQYVKRKAAGRNMSLVPTKKSLALTPKMKTAWNALNRRINGLVGAANSRKASAYIGKLHKALSK